jgi:hypothetical protein
MAGAVREETPIRAQVGRDVANIGRPLANCAWLVSARMLSLIASRRNAQVVQEISPAYLQVRVAPHLSGHRVS